jgi:hypothetical protein
MILDFERRERKRKEDYCSLINISGPKLYIFM